VTGIYECGKDSFSKSGEFLDQIGDFNFQGNPPAPLCTE
jgi:hypothetical protein